MVWEDALGRARFRNLVVHPVEEVRPLGRQAGSSYV